MGQVPTALAEARLLSISQVANEWGVSREKARKLLGDIQPAGDKAGHPAYRIRDAAKVMVVADLGLDLDGEIDPEKMAPKERKDWYDGEKQRLEVAARKGQTITVNEHRESLAMMGQMCKDALSGLADTADASMSLPPEAVELIDREARRVLTAIADQMAG